MLSDLSNKIDESFKNTNENILESSKKFLSFLRDSKKPEAASIIPPLVSAAASLTGNPLIEKAVDMVIDNSVYFSDMSDIAPPQIPVKKSIIERENDILKQLFREVYAKLMSMGSDSPDINNILELMYNALNKKIA